jgi:hypothetical protein
MNILTEIDTKQMNFCLKLTNKLYIDLCASVPLYEFISIFVFYRTLDARWVINILNGMNQTPKNIQGM